MEQKRKKMLSQDKNVQQLLDILIQYQEKGYFDSLMETVNRMQELEQTVTQMTKKMDEMNRELAEVKRQNVYLVQKAEQTMMDKLEERIHQAGQKVTELKGKMAVLWEQVQSGCRQIADNVKLQGKKALHDMVGLLHIRDGVERLKGAAERMAGGLDALSESVEQAKGTKEPVMSKEVWQKAEQPERNSEKQVTASKRFGTYKDEIQNFMGQAIAENRSYGSGADTFEAFRSYCENCQREKEVGMTEKFDIPMPNVPKRR